MKVLELFSGIGGMHYALKESGIEADVTAIEINTTANHVYKHNFPNTSLLQRNIQSFTVDEINSIAPEMIVMSPPCQPFTRVGLKRDISDERSCALRHIISVLPSINVSLRYILVENVKGFEVSVAREKLVECLIELGFGYQELMLSPSQIGVPNVRLRYYLIAKRKPLMLCLPSQSTIMETIPENILNRLINFHPTTVSDFLTTVDNTVTSKLEDHLIPDKVLTKHAWILDIVNNNSAKSCCFTKAYGHYVEGTGSVFCPFTEDKVKSVYESNPSDLEALKSLKLRYFTGEEIAKLMCFPSEFSFPDDITRKQKYRLLGNSINVKLVALLLKILMVDDENKQIL